MGSGASCDEMSVSKAKKKVPRRPESERNSKLIECYLAKCAIQNAHCVRKLLPDKSSVIMRRLVMPLIYVMVNSSHTFEIFG